jgi:chemosensory pili system protein ChpA (sensor histidine kinase/response regulator)
MPVSDPVGLVWCLPEISRSLGRVETLLAGGSTADAAATALGEAATLLHQVRGAMRLLGLSSEAVVLTEADALLAALGSARVPRDATALAALSRAFAELLAHLEDLSRHEGSASPIALLAPLQALRRAQRAAPIDLFDLYPIDMRGRGRAPQPPARRADDPPVSAVRTAFEKGLLQAMRDPASPVGPRLMARAVAAVRASPQGAGDPAFWWVADAWFSGLRGALVPLDAPARKLLARLNLHMRNTLDGGAVDGEPLLREMLQAIAPAPSGDESIDAVRAAFGLPSGLSVQAHGAIVAMTDPATLGRVRDAEAAARTTLDRFAQGGGDEWPALRDALGALAEALDATGAPGMRALGEALAQAVTAWREPRQMSAAASLELATALLFVEQALGRGTSIDPKCEARGSDIASLLASAVGGVIASKPPAWLTDLGRAGQARATEAAFIAEVQAALRTAESALDGFLREGKAAVPLADVERSLRQVAGALLFLGHEAAARAAGLLADKAEQIDASGIDAALGPTVSVGIDRLADSLAALGLFVDSLSLPDEFRPPIWFDDDSGCLRIDLRHVPPTVVVSPVAEAVSEPEPAPEPAPVMGLVAQPVVSSEAAAAPRAAQPVALDLALDISLSIAPPAVPTPQPAIEASPAPAADHGIDAVALAAIVEPSRDLQWLVDDARRGGALLEPTLEPFAIGEPVRQQPARVAPPAAEPAPAATVESQLPAEPYPEIGMAFEIDLDELTGSRAAADDGAGAHRRPDPQSASAPTGASEGRVGAGATPQDALELDLSSLDRAADFAVAEWEPEGPLQRAAIASEAAPLPAPVAAGVDDELLLIFLEEADSVLEAIAAGVLALRASPAARDSLVDVRRAFHTLKGSGRMVGLVEFGEAAWSFEKLLNAWMAESRPADAPLLDLIERAHRALREWATALDQRIAPAVDFAPLAAAAAALAQGHALPVEDHDETADDDGSAAVAEDLSALEDPERAAPDGAAAAGPSQAGADASPGPAAQAGADDSDVDSEVVRIGGRTVGRALYAVFREEAGALVALLARDVRAWRADLARGVQPDALRAAHTLAGNAGVMRLEAVQTLAEAIENAYIMQGATRCPPSDEDLAIVQAGVECIHEMLARFAAGEWPAHQPRISLELDFLIGRWSVPAEDDGDEPGPSADVDAIADFDELDALEPIEGLQPSPQDGAGVTGDDEIVVLGLPHDDGADAVSPIGAEESDLVAGVGASDAIAHALSEAEASAAAKAEADARADALAEAQAYAELDVMLESGTITDDDTDFRDELDAGLEAQSGAVPWTDALAEAETAQSPDAVADADTQADGDELAGTGRQGGFDADIRMVQIADFDRSDADHADAAAGLAMQASAAGSDEGSAQADEHLPADELDPDLLPIFIEEAADEIPRIGETLRAWALSPADARLPQTLMRLLHTVKGSARMAGAMRLGQMLHDTETRVEHLAATASPTSAQIDELIADTDRAVGLFDSIRDPSRPQAAAGNSAESFADARPQPAGEPASQPAVAEAAAPATPTAPAASAEPAAPAAPAQAAAPRPVLPAIPALDLNAAATTLVRVRADLLDRLVSEAGEVSIGRSRLDNELTLLRQSLLELNENVGRLRSQLREIEIQADTQIQARIARNKDDDGSFDPLEFDRYTRFQELARMLAESVNDVATVQGNAMRSLDNAGHDLHRQGQVLRDLQQNLMRARMVQFGSIADRLYRVIRQSGKEAGKRVNLDLRGATVEVDRSVLERMAGPMEHLLRNSVAHGIERPEDRLAAGKSETGEIQVEVRQEGREIVLSFTDDGAGLDLTRIRARAVSQGLIAEDSILGERELAELIFVPGFSTASSVTELSGRGVGMDVVRMEVSTLGGRIDTETRAGAGTRFTVHLPLTLAVSQVVLLSAGRARLAVPSASVEQVVHLQPQDLAAAYARRALSWQGKAVPLFFLGGLMQQPDIAPVAQANSPVVIVRAGHQRVAVHADEVTRNKEVVVKSVGAQAARVRGVAGATVLGNGDIVLIANAVALAQAIAGEALDRRPPAPRIEAVLPEALPPLVMVVDDSLTVRKVTQRLLAREGYRVLLARDGVDALGQLEEAVPDVMLLDIEMPRMDGFELLRHLRADARWAKIPIVMITSRTADKHRNHALGLGVDAYLGKPYAEDELLGLLERLGRRAAQAVAAA